MAITAKRSQVLKLEKANVQVSGNRFCRASIFSLRTKSGDFD
jgi:hypothetical protein